MDPMDSRKIGMNLAESTNAPPDRVDEWTDEVDPKIRTSS